MPHFPNESIFPVNIQSGGNDVFTLNTKCSINTMIKELKDIIVYERGLDKYHYFTLTYNGIVMQDNQTLGSYNINDNRHLILMVSHVGPYTQPNNSVAVATTSNNNPGYTSSFAGDTRSNNIDGEDEYLITILNNDGLNNNTPPVSINTDLNDNTQETYNENLSPPHPVFRLCCVFIILYPLDVIALVYAYYLTVSQVLKRHDCKATLG